MDKYQILRGLTEQEYAELKQSIIENGVLQPIYFDEHGNVLDGHHRMKVCEELGITQFPRMVIPGLTEEQKLDFAREVNITRRQLTPEEWLIEREKRIKERPQEVKKILQENPSLSDRQIGKQTRASHQYVGKQSR